MRLPLVLSPLVPALLLSASTAFAASTSYEIHLITMGPGDHLYTRGGHAALMVAELEDKKPKLTTIYNYGDTDWDNPWLVTQFLRGNLIFFLSQNNSLMETVNDYGVRQARTVFRQKLNLSPIQSAELAKRLQEGSVPGQREYIFHHSRSLCSTRINDLLDHLLKGKLREQLASQSGPQTSRFYQDQIFGRHYITAIAGDLFTGRLHDHILNKYESMASPELMRSYYQEIMLPDPITGEPNKVPLADPPVPLVERKEPLVISKSYFTHYFWGFLGLLTLFYGGHALKSLQNPNTRTQGTREAASFLFPTALASGMIGSFITAFILLSKVPEFRHNELILVFWPTDIWLALQARKLKTKHIPLGTKVHTYIHARLAVALLAVLGHLSGLLYQQPRILFGLGVLYCLMVWILVYRIRRPIHGTSAKEPAHAQGN